MEYISSIEMTTNIVKNWHFFKKIICYYNDIVGGFICNKEKPLEPLDMLLKLYTFLKEYKKEKHYIVSTNQIDIIV